MQRVNRYLPWLVALATVTAILLFAATARAQTLPDRRAVLTEERARFGAQLAHQDAGLLLARVAWRLRDEGFGLLRKDSGNRCPIPGSSITVACDWLVHRSGVGCDVLTDGPGTTSDGKLVPGAGGPTWCTGEPVDLSRFVAPVDPGDSATPPTTPPQDPPAETESLAAILLRLEARLAAVEAALHAIPPCTVTLPAITWPVYEGAIKVPYLGSAPVVLKAKAVQ